LLNIKTNFTVLLKN